LELPKDLSSLKSSVYFDIRSKNISQNSVAKAFEGDGNIDTFSLKFECSCEICPNRQNFCRNNGQFFSIGYATASRVSPSRTRMDTTTTEKICCFFLRVSIEERFKQNPQGSQVI